MPNPADVYQPKPGPPTGLPTSYDEVHAAAIGGIASALSSNGEQKWEVDFPPLLSANARGDGSAKSERLVHEANAQFVLKLRRALSGSVAIVGCSAGAVEALGSDALSLRDGVDALKGSDVVIYVSPSTDEQWAAASTLDSAVVVVNGLLLNGQFPHAYFYKPLTAFSQQTGGVVRCYPGPYELYDSTGQRVDELEIGLARQGRRALPDTKDAQMLLQNIYGRKTR